MKKKVIFMLSLFLIVAFAFTGLGLTYKNNKIESNDKNMIAEAATTTAENRTIQTKLKRWGYYKGSVDGIYGSQTREAVKYFQRKKWACS